VKESTRLCVILDKERTDRAIKTYCEARAMSKKLIASAKEVDRQKLG